MKVEQGRCLGDVAVASAPREGGPAEWTGPLWRVAWCEQRLFGGDHLITWRISHGESLYDVPHLS